MAENQENVGFLEKLALIADASQNLFSGRATVIFELPTELEELMVRIPGIPLIAFSNGSVI